MGGAAYYDSKDILSEEALVPITFGTGARGLGRLFDNSNAKNDVPAGSRVEAPLWLALALSHRKIASLRMPKYYSTKMQRKMEVGAGCEDLRARCPHFYEVACKMSEVTADEDMANFVNNAFRARYKELLTQAHNTNAQGVTQLQSLLSQEELQLFETGRLSIEKFDRWRRTGDSGSFNATQQKRKLSGLLWEDPSGGDVQTRQRQADA